MDKYKETTYQVWDMRYKVQESQKKELSVAQEYSRTFIREAK